MFHFLIYLQYKAAELFSSFVLILLMIVESFSKRKMFAHVNTTTFLVSILFI